MRLMSPGPGTWQLSACGEGGHTWSTPGSPPAWESPPGLPTPGPRAAGSQAHAGTLPAFGLGEHGTLTPRRTACDQGGQLSGSQPQVCLFRHPPLPLLQIVTSPPSVLVRMRGAATGRFQLPPQRPKCHPRGRPNPRPRPPCHLCSPSWWGRPAPRTDPEPSLLHVFPPAAPHPGRGRGDSSHGAATWWDPCVGSRGRRGPGGHSTATAE